MALLFIMPNNKKHAQCRSHVAQDAGTEGRSTGTGKSRATEMQLMKFALLTFQTRWTHKKKSDAFADGRWQIVGVSVSRVRSG